VLALLRAAGPGHRKKLEEAARLWARGDLQQEQEHARATAELDEQFAFFGLAPDAPGLPELEPFYLWPENRPGWTLWWAVQTQWRYANMPGALGAGTTMHTGLDYAGVHRVIDQSRAWRLRRRQRFAEILLMECACMDEWARKKAEQRQ
jgi:hypothetical protein